MEVGALRARLAHPNELEWDSPSTKIDTSGMPFLEGRVHTPFAPTKNHLQVVKDRSCPSLQQENLHVVLIPTKQTRLGQFLPVGKTMIRAKNSKERRDEAPSSPVVESRAIGGFPWVIHVLICSTRGIPPPVIAHSYVAHMAIMGNHKPSPPKEKKTSLPSHPHVEVC
ncbi:hypothetical protein AMTR_s00028p00209420 [Amborella trichopoda]|uniref:Uncharacterized protein n=1 Tax=Amborella trichopoda TaxID=13333 RepID=W1PSG3_AMBTC|nr:hypothetical protein AMTR_s00028p00209420 [Amborella trichopoda]